MDTSKSSSEMDGWQAGVWVFSGRRDPTWSLSPEHARHLVEIWSKLNTPVGAPPAGPPPLGYRGAFVQEPQGRRWYAYGGRVAIQRETLTEARADPDREFERAVVDSAPPEVLPPEVRNAIAWN
jgi:hypothetical protein